MKKILITGCNGFLGSNLIKYLNNPNYQIIGTSLNETRKDENFRFEKGDLSDLEFVKSLIGSINPDIIINTVAWTNVDECEEDLEKAHQLNVLTAENIAKSIINKDTKLIHISSDQLFDGTKSFYSEEESPNPLNVYGKTKLDAEKVCLKYHKNTTIVRTNFFGWSPDNHTPTFAEWIFNGLKEGKEIEMFTNIFFNPIEVSFLAKAIEQLFSSKYSGILNIVGSERISKYDFGIKLAKRFGFETFLITPSKYEFNFKARRPSDMSLSTKKYVLLFNFPLPNINSSLDKFFSNKDIKKTIILGAGLSGLSTAYFFEKKNYQEYLVLESSSEIGGLCKTIKKGEFIFDLAIHLLHLRKEEIIKLSKELLGDELQLQERKAGILINKKIIPYPFQHNLFHLDKEIKEECLAGAIEASNNFNPEKIPSNFNEWINSALGKGIAKYFMVPYNKKCYSLHPKDLDIEIVGKYVPKIDLRGIIQGAESNILDKKIGYNYEFYYPKNGGILSLSKAFAKGIQNLKLNEKVVKIDLQNKLLFTDKNSIYPFMNLVSTIPLKELINIIEDVPEEIKKANKELKFNKVCSVLLGVNRPKISPYHWLYIPQEDVLPYRVSFPMNYFEKAAPENTSSICAEYSYMGDKKFSDEEIINKVIKDLIKLGIINQDDEIIFRDVVELKPSYVAFDFNRKENLQLIKEYLSKNNIYSIGRYGAWEYSSMEDAIIYGKETAEKIVNM